MHPMLTRSSRQLPRHRALSLTIQDKANRILYIILIGIVLILVRVWQLTVIQHDAKVEEALKPRYRVIMEPAKRATIRDRYGIPLAINKIQYQATILYSQLHEIPSIEWIKGASEKKIKRYKRKEYISQLAQLLGQELHLDGDRIEDLIYSKAAFYVHVPFVIKEELSEKEYYRLKMLEKDWPGIHVRKIPKRHYPQGRLASDIIGYMGAINRQEYETVVHEIKTLESYLEKQELGEDPDLPPGLDNTAQIKQRLQELHERAYTINDSVGKTGIEGKFEEQLRGFQGKKIYYSDAKGNFLREMPGSRPPLSGDRFLLTISAELQEYAEQLLAQSEALRRRQHSQGSLNIPWIRGGAIVAMDPHTGEILAMASYPRFDPNDFITSGNPEISKEKRSHIQRWFENEGYLADIWNQKRPLEREVYVDKQHVFTDETLMLTWENYINLILPEGHQVRKGLQRSSSLKAATDLLKAWETLLSLSGQQDSRALINYLYKSDKHLPFRYPLSFLAKEHIENQLHHHEAQIGPLKQKLDHAFFEMDANYDKILLLDLLRLAVMQDRFSSHLMAYVANQSISDYRNSSAAFVSIQDVVKKMVKDLFHDTHFKAWRKENEKKFLKQKRLEEKNQAKYPKPYLDYLDSLESDMFQVFWEAKKWRFLISFLTGRVDDELQYEEDIPYFSYLLTWHEELENGAHQALPWRKDFLTLGKALQSLPFAYREDYLKTMREYQELNRPLYGRYRHLRNGNAIPLEKHLATVFYPKNGYGYGRSQAYRQAATQGSIFKIVTAYEALIQRYEILKSRSSSIRELNPLEIIDRFHLYQGGGTVAYTLEGTPIPRLYKGGRLPKSLTAEIGRVDLIKALETSSNPYFALLAGDVIENPEDLGEAARLFSYGQKTGIDLPAEIPGRVPTDLSINRTGLYSLSIGQHSLVVTPLQTAVMLSAIANGGQILKPQIVSLTVGEKLPYDTDFVKNNRSLPFLKREVPLPHPVRNTILEGMHRAVIRIYEEGIKGLERLYQQYPEAVKSYAEKKDFLVGKSSSAESMEQISLDLETGTQKITHIWFGGISFDHEVPLLPINVSLSRDHYGKPDLVVVVYLRFGNYGKEAAPIAAQMIKKWHEIKKTTQSL